LLGGPGSRPAPVDALAARTLVKGEALAPPAGRADDFTWPRREIGREQAKGETPVATVTPDGTAHATPGAPPAPPKPKKVTRPAHSPFGNFFGFGGGQRQPQPAPPQRGPRPPGNVGQRASAPGFFAR
jgi:hypothetical protein